MELLLFDRSKVSPDFCVISVTKIADFGQDIFDVLGCFSIIAGNGGADKFEAFEMGGGVKLCGRSGKFYLHGFFGSFIKKVRPPAFFGIVTPIAH